MTGNPPVVKKPSLMTLAFERREIIDVVIESGGEITPDQDVALVGTDKAIDEKIEAYLAVIDHVEASQAYAKEQARIASNYASSCDNLVGNLRTRICQALKIADKAKVKAGFRTVSLSKGAPKLVIDDQNEIPAEFSKIEYVEKITIQKKEIMEAIAAGTEVPGARMVESEDGIRITKARGKGEQNDEQ